MLIAPLGLWRDDHPVPDISGIPPASLPALVFADPNSPLAALLPAPDPTDPDSLFRASQTMASILQFIWPLPDKGLSKRLYRLKAPTLLVWGAQDALVAPGLRRRLRGRSSPTRGSRSSTAPATSRSSSRPSARSR